MSYWLLQRVAAASSWWSLQSLLDATITNTRRRSGLSGKTGIRDASKCDNRSQVQFGITAGLAGLTSRTYQLQRLPSGPTWRWRRRARRSAIKSYLAQARSWKAARKTVPPSFEREVQAQQPGCSTRDLAMSALRMISQMKQAEQLTESDFAIAAASTLAVRLRSRIFGLTWRTILRPPAG